jgi:eukaryotic-like serine/threonine-protein kinase
MHDATAATTGRLVCGRYRLQEPIGRGAMGIVWRGRDELLDRDVAVKEVRAAAESDSVYQRTLREARAAARLNHPGVVTVFDVVEEDGSPWIVMELAHARSLDRLIAEDGPLRPTQAAQVGEQLLSALECAHAAGVLHRDVKPGNVLVAADSTVKLTDFGIATYPGDPALTQVGMVFGTPGFTAPERVRGETATPASDLWSLGATLYTAVEGRGPFDRPGGAAAIFAGVAHEPAPRAPSAGRLGPVIDALLRADPAQRPDAATAARLLRDAAAQADSGPAFPGGFAVPGGYPAFADVREFPPMPPPADLPASADLPEFLDQPVHAGLPGFPGQPDAASLPTALDPPAPGVKGAGPPWLPAADGLPAASQPISGPPPASPPAANPPAAGPAQPRPRGPGRALVAAAMAVAMAAAAFIGWAVYPRPTGAASDPGPAAAVVQGAGEVGGPTPAAGTGGRQAHGTASTAAGDGSTASSSNGDPGPGSGAANVGGGTAAPAGYQWFQVTPASSGTAAGFKIAAPATWQLTTQGQVSYLRPPAGPAYIEISLAPFTYPGPLREAAYLQAQALRQDLYPGYRLIAIRAGTFLGEPDAVWRFSWLQGGTARIGVLQWLVNVATPAGTQGYELAVSAASGTFAWALTVFRRALQTFQPLT